MAACTLSLRGTSTRRRSLAATAQQRNHPARGGGAKAPPSTKPDKRGNPFFQCRACRLRVFGKTEDAGRLLSAARAQLLDGSSLGILTPILAQALPPCTEPDPWAWPRSQA